MGAPELPPAAALLPGTGQAALRGSGEVTLRGGQTLRGGREGSLAPSSKDARGG